MMEHSGSYTGLQGLYICYESVYSFDPASWVSLWGTLGIFLLFKYVIGLSKTTLIQNECSFGRGSAR